jgi:Ca2+/Na+ antiporter
MSTNKNKNDIKHQEHDTLPLTRKNFIFMAVAGVMIVLGFLLMVGGGSQTAAGDFNPDIFSARRIVVGPTLAFLGFVAMAAAIIIRPESLKK